MNKVIVLGLLVSFFTAGCSSPENPLKTSSPMYTYTLTFDDQGADQAPVPASLTVKDPATVLGSLPTDPVKAGWKFEGWYTQPKGQGTPITASTVLSGDQTAYAFWKFDLPSQFTWDGTMGTVVVSDMKNGGFTVSYTPKSALSWAHLYVTYGNSSGLALANQDMVNQGGVWTYTKSDASYKGGVKIGFDILQLANGVETSVPQGKLSDTATWASFSYSEMYTYTITFDDQGATTPASYQSKSITNPETTVGALPTPPLKTGYIFDGWFTGPSGTGSEFKPSSPVGSDLTVYAAWSSAKTWTVTYDGQGAEVEAIPTQATVYTGKPVKTLPVVPSRAGYAFYGWYTAPQGQGQAFNESSVVTADITVYAWWKESTTSALFGPNVVIFDPSMTSVDIQSRLDMIFHSQQKAEFGSNRYALMFKPGTYNVNVNVGFYMQVLGLGQSPNDVLINGSVQSDGASDVTGNHHVTQNFWRSMENLSVDPTAQVWNMWGVSQAAPARRIHVKGDLWLFDVNPNNNASGWASGGFLADSLVDGSVAPGGQQQWLYRNSDWGSATGGVWNMVFVGSNNAPATSFGKIPNYTTTAKTPVIREKPYLYVDGSDQYHVFVPSLSTDSQGPTWVTSATPGVSLPLDAFHVAKPGVDTAQTINAALAAGKNILLTPGIYHLEDTLRVQNADTIVLGLGLATLVAPEGLPALTVADVDGVTLAGLLIEAGVQNSPVLMQIGPPGSAVRHAAHPTLLADVFFRVGGAIPGKATLGLEINASDVIGDNLWIWRADHGIDTSTWGWTVNPAETGLIVNGTDVTIYGLAVEHFQKYQTVWNGNGGRVYFYQSELPYDVPDQAAWMNGKTKGYASYKVADTVTSHFASGVGIYCFFNVNASVQLESAIEVPPSGLNGAMFHNMVTVALGSAGAVGQINHVINNVGAAVVDAGNPTYLVQ